MTFSNGLSRAAVRAALLFALFFSLNCQQLMDLLDNANKVDDTAANANTDLDKAGSWTILVYLDADNNLEGAGVGDVIEMMGAAALSGGLNGNKVYVLMDRIGPGKFSGSGLGGGIGNFDGAILFEVVSGGTTLTPIAVGTGSVPFGAGTNATVVNGTTYTGYYWTANTTGAAATDELNMGAQQTLENFLAWGLNQAKTVDQTDYVYLDIWDHGAGWGGGAYGGNAVAWDDSSGTSHDALSIDEIRNALKNQTAATGKRVTILGFDACYMGTIENAYSFKDHASIMIGSEDVEPGAGWQYTNWLPRGKMSPRAVATNVVTTFKASYNGSGEQVTLSAIDLSKLSGITTALDSFLAKVATQSPTLISSARQQSQSYNNDLSVDLYDFVNKVNIPEGATLKNMITASLVAEAHTTGGKVDGSRGMTIYFPQSKDNYDASYNNTVFAQSTRWDDFISGKVISIEISSNEPADSTCGAESNDTAAKAVKLSLGLMAGCTGYVYTPSDVDIYRFGLTGMTATNGTITVTLSNIPAGADFDVLLFNTDVSPSAPIAAGVRTGNTTETYTLNAGTGSVTYPGLTPTTCDPTDSSNVLYKQGLCYGTGVFDTTAGSSNNFYLVIVGKNNSYNQVGKYSVSLTAANGASLAAVP